VTETGEISQMEDDLGRGMAQHIGSLQREKGSQIAEIKL